MKISVALDPAEIALLPRRDLRTCTCVVFDVLRATSSMITALAGGTAEIHPVCTIEDAQELKEDLPRAILAGERNGDRIDGFDLGNSPLEYRQLPGKKIITTTTNGTVALRACEHADAVLVGALLNIGALAREIEWRDPENLLLVCAGTFEEFALEDAYAAGCLIEALLEAVPGAELSDGAHAVRAVARQFATPLAALQAARNGRTLKAKGRADEVAWCAQLSFFDIVGEMDGPVIRPCAP